MALTLEIPDSIADGLPIPPLERRARLLIELSVALYAQRLISIGRACELAGIDRFSMGTELAQRGIERHVDVEDVRQELLDARQC